MKSHPFFAIFITNYDIDKNSDAENESQDNRLSEVFAGLSFWV